MVQPHRPLIKPAKKAVVIVFFMCVSSQSNKHTVDVPRMTRNENLYRSPFTNVPGTQSARSRDALSSMIGPQVSSERDHSPLTQHLAATVRQSMAPTSLYQNQYPPVSAYLRIQARPLASVFEVPSPTRCHTRYSWHENHIFSIQRTPFVHGCA